MTKYKSVKTEVNGINFASKKEANRYMELLTLEKHGDIYGLEFQVPFELQPKFKINGKTVRAIKYVADFVYFDRKKKIHVEDVKGYRNGTAYQVFKIKKKLFEYKYKIEVEEI